jgi:hypothetical protein
LFATGVAGELSLVEVVREKQAYRVTIRARIDAPRSFVYASLTDYARLTLLSPAVRVSEVIGDIDANVKRVHTLTHLCAFIFCKDLDQVQDMTMLPHGELTANIVPGRSDFRAGFARWTLHEEGGATRLVFGAELIPDFWLPPLIDRLILRKMLRIEALNTIAGLEQLHRQSLSP